MSVLIPALALAAFGEVVMLPITCIEHLTLQNLMGLLGGRQYRKGKFFLQSGLAQILYCKGFRGRSGYFLPKIALAIFFLLKGESLRPLLLTSAEHLCEQYFFGSDGFVSNVLPHSGR